MATYQVCDKNGDVITRSLADIYIPITGTVSPGSNWAVEVTNSLFSWYFIQDDGLTSGDWSVQVAGNTLEFNAITSGPNYPGPTYSASGSFFSASGGYLELRCDYGEPAGGNPWFNGVPDGVPLTTADYYWYLPGDQEVTLTATCPLGTATKTDTPAPGRWNDDVFVLISAHGRDISAYDEHGAIYTIYGYVDISVDVSSLGSISAAVNLFETYIDDSGTCSSSVQGSTLNAQSIPVDRGPLYYDQTNTSQAEATFYPALPVSAEYVILTPLGDYPDNITVSAILGGGTLATPQTLSGASGGFTATQEQYSATATAYTLGTTEAKNTYGPVALSITSDSLLAQGEDYVVPGYGVDTTPRITRLPFRGRKFPAIAVTHAESYSVPDWDNLGYWAGTNGAAVTQDDSGNIVITAAGDRAGGATFTYPVDPENTSVHNCVSALSYRFLNVTTPTGVASPAFTLTIPPCSVYIDPTVPPPPFFADAPGSIGPPEDVYGGPETPWKQWSVGANVHGLQGCDGDVDLCGPDLVKFGTTYVPLDPTLALDRGTRWPIPSRMMACQGVWRIEQIVLDGVPAGETLTISSLSLRRRNQPSYDGLDQWNRGRLIETSDGDELDPEWESGQTWAASTLETDEGESHTSHYERRGILSVVDGKQAVEEAVFWYSYFEGASGTSYHIFETESISQTVARINARDGVLGIYRYPGVTATSLRPVTPSCSNPYGSVVLPDTCYMNETGPAAWLCNHDTSMGIPTDDSTGVATLYARQLIDQITPCFGLDWSQFEAIAVLRGSAQGLYLAATDKHTPQAGINFQLIETDDVPPGSAGSVRGSSVTSAPGFYSTGLSYGRGPNVSHKVVSADTTPNVNIPFVGTDWRARYRHRATSCGDFTLCCTTQLGDPLTYFPFTPQFSDPNATPSEEWRRIGGGTGFGEQAQAAPTSTPAAEEPENTGDGATAT